MNTTFIVSALFGSLIIMISASSRFDQPTYPLKITKNLSLSDAKPTHITTTDRSKLGFSLYLGLLFLLFLLLCLLGPQAAKLFGIPASLTPSWPAAVAAVLVGISTADDKRLLGRLEHAIRLKAHELALIPRNVLRLSSQLEGAGTNGIRTLRSAHSNVVIEEFQRFGVSEREALDYMGGVGQNSANQGPMRSSQASGLWLECFFLYCSLKIGLRNGIIPPEFSHIQESEIDYLESRLGSFLDPGGKRVTPNKDVASPKTLDSLQYTKGRAALLLASALLYRRRSQKALVFDAKTIGLELDVEDLSNEIRQTSHILISWLILTGLVVFLINYFLIFPYSKSELYKLANAISATPDQTIAATAQLTNDAWHNGFTIVFSGFLIYTSVTIILCSFRDRLIMIGEWSEAPIDQISFLIKTSMFISVIIVAAMFIVTRDVTASNIITLSAVGIQCFVSAAFLLWHLREAVRGARRNRMMFWLFAFWHALLHAAVAFVLCMFTFELSRLPNQWSAIVQRAEAAVIALGTAADAIVRSPAGPENWTLSLADPSQEAADDKKWSGPLGDLKNVLESIIRGRLHMPTESGIHSQWLKLNSACGTVGTALRRVAPKNVDLPKLPPGSDPRPACLLEELTLFEEFPAGTDAVIKLLQSKINELDSAFFSAIGDVITQKKSPNQIEDITQTGLRKIYYFSSFLFAFSFSFITILLRSSQLRGNRRNLAEAKALFFGGNDQREDVDFQKWLYSPLNDKEGNFSKTGGMAPFELLAYESPRRSLFNQLRPQPATT